MSAYERFRKDIDDGQYDDMDPSKKTKEDLLRETGAAIAGGAMSHDESRLLLFRYIDRLVRLLTRRSNNNQETIPARGVKGRHADVQYERWK